MITILIAAALGGSAVEPTAISRTGPEPSIDECKFDAEAMLRLSPYEFDQGPAGWRSLEPKYSCYIEMANLIATHREKHWGSLPPEWLHASYWHEGQARALAGQTDAAVKLLLAGVDPHSIWGFSDYALATVAFLQNDLQGLKSARARLAGLPRPTEFDGAKWPPNLEVVDGLLTCFGKPYSEAYSSECIPT